ncbi:sensor histidine kinase [Rarobacter incanus]|uniref:sensor histidine kinase n=1 Tax=Rarobacter incanus TaxID=153494 RepID=UPI001150FA67|nr:HAMP domain-containing sensor histidine kinase [Rarobacter incanus]
MARLRTGRARVYGARAPLRTQIVTLVVALLAVLSAITTTVSYFSLQSTLYKQLDTQLDMVAGRAAGVRGPRPPDSSADSQTMGGQDGAGAPQDAGAQTGSSPSSNTTADANSSQDATVPSPGDQIPNAVIGGTIVVRVTNGVVNDAGYFNPESGAYTTLTDKQIAALQKVRSDASARSVSVPELGTMRVIARTDHADSVVITAMPMTQMTTTLRDYLVVSVGASTLLVIVAGFLGAILVRRSLRPLDRMATAAQAVSKMELSRGEVDVIPRVPVHTDGATEVDHVGTALNTMLSHVETSLAARHESEMQVRQFVADASHELRTPLASIRGYAELIERSHQELSAETHRSIDRIHSEAIRMGGLVEDMLLLARLDAGRGLAHEQVDLSALAIDAITDAHAAGRDHDWVLDLPDDSAVEIPGDEARLRQVFANLLANARVHTPAGTRVTLSVAATSTGATIDVCDNGPGISPELLPRIFQRFTRADSARSRSGGSTGLGLAIVAAIVKSHGGKVDVSSGDGKTSFNVWLPGASA